jgi:hypothetical protein
MISNQFQSLLKKIYEPQSASRRKEPGGRLEGWREPGPPTASQSRSTSSRTGTGGQDSMQKGTWTRLLQSDALRLVPRGATQPPSIGGPEQLKVRADGQLAANTTISNDFQ